MNNVFEVLVRLKSDIAVIIFIKTHNYQEVIPPTLLHT